MSLLVALFAYQTIAFTSPPALQKTPVRTKGTAPMPGGFGKFGQTYKISRDGMPINFTVLSAQYSTATYNVRSNLSEMVDANHKLLVIHYSIENPNTSDLYVASWSLFQAVDSSDQTIPDSAESRRATDKNGLSMTIKPGQSIDDIVTYISVPSEAKIPKLILKYAPVKSNYKVIRYMMGAAPNLIKPLKPPFADPTDKSGSRALAQITSTVGATYSTGFCDLSVDSIELIPGHLGALVPPDGKQFLVAKVTATNKAWAGFYFNGKYKVTVKTDDDKLSDFSILKAGHDEAFQGLALESGETSAQRIVIPVSKDAKLNTLSIAIDMGNEGITRAFVYDLSMVK